MHRFFLPPNDCREDTLTLTGSEAHHAMRVLRVQTGERVSVLDGAGQILDCTIASASGKSVSLKVVNRVRAAAPPCAVTLLQAVPKGKIIESIIQKAVELGAARVVPIVSERVVSQIDSDAAEAKAAKWRQVAVEAMKQCGNAWLPKVEAPISLPSFLDRAEKFDLALVGCLESGSRHPRVWFEKYRAGHNRNPATVGVWVGPEGDFTAREYALIKGAGGSPITLGPLVLRVETAAVYCLSVINYEITAAHD